MSTILHCIIRWICILRDIQYHRDGDEQHIVAGVFYILYQELFGFNGKYIKGIERNCFREKSFPFSRNFIAYHFVIKKEEDGRKKKNKPRDEIYTSKLNKSEPVTVVYLQSCL